MSDTNPCASISAGTMPRKYHKMNPEVKEKWLAALRSGNYAQGKGVLREGDGFCCLGVLCDVAINEGVLSPWTQNSITRSWKCGDDNSDEGYAITPRAVQTWARIDETGTFREDHTDENPGCLTMLNDFAGYNFAQIADVIEEYL